MVSWRPAFVPLDLQRRLQQKRALEDSVGRMVALERPRTLNRPCLATSYPKPDQIC